MRKSIFILIMILLQTVGIDSAHGRFYLTEDEALKIAFYDVTTVEKKTIWFEEDEIKEIESMTGQKIGIKRVSFYVGKKDGKITGYAVIDSVIGKKEFITYMLILEPDFRVRQVEILVFRESQGYEIENKRWREQFTGKDIKSPLQLNKDIINISGATLSCRAITGGIRKILAIFETVVKMNN